MADSGCGALQTLLAVEKAIRESPMQLSPRLEGQELLVPVPQCASAAPDMQITAFALHLWLFTTLSMPVEVFH